MLLKKDSALGACILVIRLPIASIKLSANLVIGSIMTYFIDKTTQIKMHIKQIVEFRARTKASVALPMHRI